MLHGILHRNDLSQLEECGLQHHVGAVAQTQSLRLLVGVNDVEFNVVFSDILQNIAGDLLLQLILGPLAVEQEASVGLQLGDDVVLGQIGLVVAGHKVGIAHIIGGADGLLAEAQVTLGNAEGLLGVILKVSLAVHICGVADNLNGVLVGTHGTVGAKAPEFAGDGSLRLAAQCRANRQGQMGHIIHNTDGEVVLRLRKQQVIVHSLYLSGGGVLAGQAVAARIDLRTILIVDVSGADILIQRLADGADLLHAVQNRDLLHRLGHS